MPRQRKHLPLSVALSALFFLLSVFLQTLLSYRTQGSVGNVNWNNTSINPVLSENVLKLVSNVCTFIDPYIHFFTFSTTIKVRSSGRVVECFGSSANNVVV